MANFQTTENAKISATSTAQAATFPGGIQRVYIVSDADVYISFDETVAVVGQSLLIKANIQPVEINFFNGNVQKLWAICSSTANVYLLGVRS